MHSPRLCDEQQSELPGQLCVRWSFLVLKRSSKSEIERREEAETDEWKVINSELAGRVSQNSVSFLMHYS